MQGNISPLAKLEAALSDGAGVYVNASVDSESYLAGLADDIRDSMCDPFPVTATVTEPGFPDRVMGSTINAVCLAYRVLACL